MPLQQCSKKEEKKKRKRVTRRIKEGITKRDFIACSKFKPATVKIGNALYAMIFYFIFFNFLTLGYWLASEEVFSIKWL
jgi:hypothetical protein